MGHSREDLDLLIEACKEVWMALDQGLLQSLIDSMEKRLRVVQKAHGWQTKY